MSDYVGLFPVLNNKLKTEGWQKFQHFVYGMKCDVRKEKTIWLVSE